VPLNNGQGGSTTDDFYWLARSRNPKYPRGDIGIIRHAGEKWIFLRMLEGDPPAFRVGISEELLVRYTPAVLAADILGLLHE